ncbi:hypothetical protein [Gordonia sp. OPL2]|uniref:hypothetical protein n=1 Tax=Gordonia sp. OPL2 TaxID=2486274 RepID=UPI0016553163|nr:hypothetical protein [Gordonia sp. OPL2]ROZ88971.1 hypothetical protein EEB19_19875 [Gordonia sp. OPL2]
MTTPVASRNARRIKGRRAVDRQARYVALYRYLTGATTSVRIDLATIATLWRAGSAEVQDTLTAAVGQDVIWAALEVAENGYCAQHGSGYASMPVQLIKRRRRH